MTVLHDKHAAHPPWEDPRRDAAGRATLDQVLAEWVQRRSALSTAIQCPGCGRVSGEHMAQCDFSWLLLPHNVDATQQDQPATG